MSDSWNRLKCRVGFHAVVTVVDKIEGSDIVAAHAECPRCGRWVSTTWVAASELADE